MNNEDPKYKTKPKSSLVDQYNRLAETHQLNQAKNPFSSNYKLFKPNKNDSNYAVPTNELTFQRGVQAHNHIYNEIAELVQIIKENGSLDANGRVYVQFKRLFHIYTTISNKLVGLLLRARKIGLVSFEGEMLFQGRDDFVLIYLV